MAQERMAQWIKSDSPAPAAPAPSAPEAAPAADSGKTEAEMAQERMAQWIKTDSPAPSPPKAPAALSPEMQQVSHHPELRLLLPCS